jgi:hypothetical protein
MRRRFLLRTSILLAAGLLRPRLPRARLSTSTYDLLRDRSLNFQLNAGYLRAASQSWRTSKRCFPGLYPWTGGATSFSAASDRALAAGHLRTLADRANLGKARISLRLGATSDLRPWDLPSKPKLMRWKTYSQLARRYVAYQLVLEYLGRRPPTFSQSWLIRFVEHRIAKHAWRYPDRL